MIPLHINGKPTAICPSIIAALLPPVKGKGCLVCESFESYIQVDETVEEVMALIEEYNEPVEFEDELAANDDD